ncbi:hypothetical protein [Variovorax boronicumulans]|uniref:hypothetical protein n=1 Tax=Variovorax boronicumulans TaxID=436515 RepID=UPI001C58BD5E
MNKAHRALRDLLLLGLFAIFGIAQAQIASNLRRPKFAAMVPMHMVDLSGGCHFTVSDLKGHHFRGPDKDGVGGVSFYLAYPSEKKWVPESAIPLFCTKPNAKNEMAADLGANELSFRLGAKQVSDEWVPVDLRERTCDPKRFPEAVRKGIDVNAPCFYPEEHFKAFEFRGKNWLGTGTLLDATTGEPKFRQRTFNYCLIPEKGESILCGYTQVRYLSHPSGDVLFASMKMLSSIEFVDSLPSTSAPTVPRK